VSNDTSPADTTVSPGTTAGNDTNSVDTTVSPDTTSADTLSASARNGKVLFDQHKCLSCHTIDGSKELAPPIKGLFGSKRKLEDGSTVVADEGYIKESMQYPGAKVVLGFNDNMPSYRDLMTEQEFQEVTDYIKALR